MKAVANELNYSPNSIARSLATRKTDTIGVIVNAVTNPFFAKAFKGIQETAFNQDYTVLVNSISDSNESGIKMFSKKNVNGLNILLI